jgi:malonate-semialdehyde dehydrogenase (acetylating) / methylmalonate-semialdehyde dehydrogenase
MMTRVPQSTSAEMEAAVAAAAEAFPAWRATPVQQRQRVRVTLVPLADVQRVTLDFDHQCAIAFKLH